MRIQGQEMYSPSTPCHPIPFQPLFCLFAARTFCFYRYAAAFLSFYVANSGVHVYLTSNSIFMIGNYITLDAGGTSTSSRREKNAYQREYGTDSEYRSWTCEIWNMGRGSQSKGKVTWIGEIPKNGYYTPMTLYRNWRASIWRVMLHSEKMLYPIRSGLYILTVDIGIFLCLGVREVVHSVMNLEVGIWLGVGALHCDSDYLPD